MQTYKVVDLLETAYLYTTTKKDLINLIEKCKAALNGITPNLMPNDIQMKVVEEVVATKQIPTFDLAGMHVTDDATQKIAMYQANDRIHFIDSENPGRNAVLKYNADESMKVEVKAVDMPVWEDDEDIIQYLNKLDPNVIYKFKRNEDMELYFALACFYILSGHKQNFLVSGGEGMEFLRYIHSGVQPDAFKDEDEFFALDIRRNIESATVDIVTLNHTTNKIVTREQLTMDYDKAWSSMYLVPRSIEDIQKYGKTSDAYKSLLDKAFADISNYQTSKPNDLYTILIEANDHKE